MARLDVLKYKEMKIKALKESVSKMETKPVLAVIVADGYSEASARYVRNKHKLAEEIGIEVIETRIKQEEYSNEWLEAYINVLNNSERVSGIIVQLPFFDVDVDYISSLISHEKDVDGFHPINLGKLMRGEDCLASCTPQGIMGLLEYQGIDLKGKDVCIVGRSNIVGKPLANMMINKGATVTVCNSNTKNLIRNVYNADIVVTAIGKAKYFEYHHFNPFATVIDVGINFDTNGKMCGDVDYEDVVDYVDWLTPVPNGCGQTTLISLMENVIKAKLALDNKIEQ